MREGGGVVALLKNNMKAISNALPTHLTPERFLRIAATALSRSPDLLECTSLSLINSIVESSMLGLEIGGPLALAHIIPFNSYNKKLKMKVKEATLIVGYNGYRQLAFRSGQIGGFHAHPVFSTDAFDYEYGTEPYIRHKPDSSGKKGELIYAYAVAFDRSRHMIDFEVIDQHEADRAKAKSAKGQYDSGPWKDDPAPMWVKTAVRRLAKRLPMSPEMQRAASIEDAAENDVESPLEHITDADFIVETTRADALTDALKEKNEDTSSDPCPDTGKPRLASDCSGCLNAGCQFKEREPGEEG